MTIDIRTSRNLRLGLGWTAVAALAVVASWSGGIAMDILMTVMTVLHLVTGGTEVLPFQFDLTATIPRVVAAAAMVALAWRLIRYRRVGVGACGRCGRDDTARADRRRLAVWAAWLSAVPALGYATLKLHWGFGGQIGITDPDLFAGVQPWSPGFGDTAVLAVLGVGLTLAMAHRRPRLPRWLLLTPAILGCLMLLPVAVLGTITNVVMIGEGGLPGMSGWVGWFVYGCFTAWGASLAIVTVEYLYRARGRCRACGRGALGGRGGPTVVPDARAAECVRISA